MKKITLLSIVTAAMLLTGCNNASSNAKEATATAGEASSSTMDTAKEKMSQAADTTKEKAAETMEAVKEKTADAVEATENKAKEVAMAAKEKAAEMMDSAKEKAADAVEATKEKAAEMTGAADKKTSPDSGQGKALYAKCAGCHGSDGKTKALGKSDIIAGMDAAVIAEDLKGYKAGILNKHGMGGIMKGQAAPLSDADISVLSAYISSLK